jgi:hypothetical protein
VTVGAGRRVTASPIRLTPFATISGRVLDENGDPVAGAAVTACRIVFQSFTREWHGGETATTNQRGEFRLFDIEPGAWVLKVHKRLKPPAATGQIHGALPEMDYPDSYHPGVHTPEEAEPLLLAGGAQLADVSLRVRKTRVFHVRGKVAGGAPASIRDLNDTWTVEIKPDGTFDIGGFPSGRYRLVAESGAARSTVQEVTVQNRDVDGLAFHIDGAIGIAGAVEGMADKADSIRVWLEPADTLGGNRAVQVSPDGRFTLAGLAPQRYRVSTRGPDGTYLKSVRFGPQDVSDSGVIEVVPGAGPLTLGFATDTGGVAGTVIAAGASELPVYVTIAPTGANGERLDRIEFTQVEDADGAFELYDMPPGDYTILACETTDVSLPQFPGFRKLFEGRSEAVTVRPGERASVRLKVISAAEAAEARTKLR